MKSRANWIIVSGTIFDIEYAKILRRYTEEEVGAYVKNHIRKLFDHFVAMSQCNDSGGKIWKYIKKYKQDNKLNLSDLSNQEFEQAIQDIDHELEKYDDKDIVKHFQAYSEESDGYFVKISKLDNPIYKEYQ